MIFFAKQMPENPKLKEWFSWRYTAVTEHQMKDLTNKLADEIVMRAQFLTCLNMDKPPVRMGNGLVGAEPGTKISLYTLRSADKKAFLPLFTDKEELEKWKVAELKDATRVVVGYDDIVRLLHTYGLQGFAINPFTDNYTQSTRVADAWMEVRTAALKAAQKK